MALNEFKKPYSYKTSITQKHILRMIGVSTINGILVLGFLILASAYIVYFAYLAGLPLIIIAESVIIALIAGLMIRQRIGVIASSITYIVLLVVTITSSTIIAGAMALHIYAGILLAINIILAILGLGLIRR